LIPFFFALQQFFEGVVWLGLTDQLKNSTLTAAAKDIYLFFALGFWPVWIPLSFFIAETEPKRRKLLLLILVLGIGVTYVNLSMLPPSELHPTVTGHSIRYLTEAPFYKKSFYLLVVAVPSFISSIKYSSIFGLTTIITCLIAEYFYSATFTSVWCFAAALMSLFLYLMASGQLSISMKNERKNA
jgi:low temperature requirement protein LtrA